MALCAFFGLKNTPLAPLLHTSHTQLNLLHRFVGYTTILQVFLHAVFYTMHFARKNSWETLVEEGNIEGIFAGVAMLVLLMGILRRWAYELFYASHIAGFITAVVLVGLHRPDWAKKLPVVMLFTASIWMLDRIIQTARMLHSLVNNHATFHPLPDGGTRLILKKPCADAASPGSHCFLWIPRIHIFENHPFTIVSNGPSGLELVMKSHRGFTKAVHSFASRYPSCITWAAVDGPYVSLPDLENYDHLILIAGGSGAAFTFGLMNRIISEPDRFRPHSIQFVWSVRRRGKFPRSVTPYFFNHRAEHTSWFHDHVQNITRAIPNARTTIYITSDEPITGPNAGICTRVLSGEIQSMIPHESDPHTYGAIPELDGMDGLSTRAAYARLEQIATIKCMKMETEAVICEATRAINNDQRVLVAACGPQSLMDAVRDSAESWRTRLGLRLCIHCEDFNN